MVFASSSSVYGNNKRCRFPKRPGRHTDFTVCRHEKAGEALCHTYHKLYGINTACLRFHGVRPSNTPISRFTKFTERILKGRRFPFTATAVP